MPQTVATNRGGRPICVVIGAYQPRSGGLADGLDLKGEVDFCIDGNSFQQLDLAQKGIDVVTIAAVFQKNPVAILAHPGAGERRFEDLRDKTLFLTDQSRRTVWPWLQRRYRLSETQVRSPDGDLESFLADPASVVIGDVIAESFAIRTSSGIEREHQKAWGGRVG